MQLSRLHPHRPEDGTSSVEYGLMLAVIALVIVLAVTFFGTLVSDLYANVF
jgi:Flp pilus assembly pilin Flp